MRDTKIVTAEVAWCVDYVYADSVKIEFSKVFQNKVISAQELIQNNTDISSVELSVLVQGHIKILELFNDEDEVIDDFIIGSFTVAVHDSGILLTVYSKHDGGEQIEVSFSNDMLLDKEVSLDQTDLEEFQLAEEDLKDELKEYYNKTKNRNNENNENI